MRSLVVSQSVDVKDRLNSDSVRSIDVGRIAAVETIGERIDWALKQAGLSAREASRRAGLGETQLGLVIARYRKNPDAEVTLPMLLMVARGLGVVDAWLLTGRGNPFDPAATFQGQAVLRDRSEWLELRRLAEQRAAERGRDVPPWAWDSAGLCALPSSVRPTASLVLDLACLCAEHGSPVRHDESSVEAEPLTSAPTK